MLQSPQHDFSHEVNAQARAEYRILQTLALAPISSFNRQEEIAKLNREQVKIPASVLGNLVVRNDECANLSLCQMIESDCRNGNKTEQLRCLETAVSGNDRVLTVDQHRIDETKGIDLDVPITGFEVAEIDLLIEEF